MNSNAKDSAGTVRSIATGGLFIALVFVATMFINLRLPIASNGGLVHLGNVPLILGAALYGRKTGAVAGAFGMALFDLVSGWAPWAPFTFIIVGLMGYTIGLIAHSTGRISTFRLIMAIIAAAVIKVTGYYAAEVLLYGNWVIPLGSIPGNLMQIGLAAVISLPAVRILYPICHNVQRA